MFAFYSINYKKLNTISDGLELVSCPDHFLSFVLGSFPTPTHKKESGLGTRLDWNGYNRPEVQYERLRRID